MAAELYMVHLKIRHGATILLVTSSIRGLCPGEMLL